MGRAEKHLDNCDEKDCRFINGKGICCYGLRNSHCAKEIGVDSIIKENKPPNIALIIDQWYFEWKDKMTENGTSHSLGFAKEDLKKRLEKYGI